MFHAVPSRLIGFRLRVRLYDDRLDCFVGQSLMLALRRGRSGDGGRHGHVVDCRHAIHSLRRKPMALLKLGRPSRFDRVCRDALFPRTEHRLAWERLLAAGDPRAACKAMVALLALAHERGCEAELATALAEQMQGTGLAGGAGSTIGVAALRKRFAPRPQVMPEVVVQLPPVASYDALLPLLGAAA